MIKYRHYYYNKNPSFLDNSFNKRVRRLYSSFRISPSSVSNRLTIADNVNVELSILSDSSIISLNVPNYFSLVKLLITEV